MKNEPVGRGAIENLQGIGVSPGIAIGPAYCLEKKDYQSKKYYILPDDAGKEVRRFRKAVAASATQLRKLKRKLARKLGDEHTYILDAHIMLLQDHMLIDEVVGLVRRNGLLHGLNVLTLPMIGRIFTLNRQLDDDIAGPRAA